MTEVTLAEFRADIMQQAEDISFFRTKPGIERDLLSAMGNRPAVIILFLR